MSSSAPTSPSPSVASSKSQPQQRFRGGDFSLYEAVAGRVITGENERLRQARRLGTLDRYQGEVTENATRRRIAPEDVIFRRRHAPTRYAEHDIYWANERDLPDGGGGSKPVLPDKDLLTAIHGYTCRFYEAMDRRISAGRKASSEASPAGEEYETVLRKLDEKSMDETALLSFAVLLEEAGRSALGKTGDLAFVEAEGEEEAFASDQVVPRQPPLGGSEQEEHNRPPSQSREVESMPVEPEEERRPKKKRRRNLSGHCWTDASINDA
ncbi:hypothetical protein V8F33_013121 [Rhypophila sp. PSN 637]